MSRTITTKFSVLADGGAIFPAEVEAAAPWAAETIAAWMVQMDRPLAAGDWHATLTYEGREIFIRATPISPN